VVQDAQIGYRVALRAHADNSAGYDQRRSKLTPVVVAATPSAPLPGQTPDVAPGPDPGPDLAIAIPGAPSSGATRQFPSARIKGTVFASGARIGLLRVKAPSKATVVVRCDGPGCNVRRRSLGSGRIASLERLLRAGARITIRVSMGGSIGKYVRIVIRGGHKPKRLDACLLPGRLAPVKCPRP